MSSSFSDTTGSQLDSDINFLPNYIMEIEDDAVQPHTDSSTQSDEDQWPGLQPSQDEPIADPAWIAQYNEERRAEEERRQLLMSRLNGTIHVSDW
jgi:hypothetical protein